MPDTGYDATSSEEEESSEEVVITKKKSFGFRVAQSPQQVQQQVLSQIGSMANELQANEVVVQQAAVVQEKSEAERKALAERERMVEAQKLAQAQQVAAMQQAAAAGKAQQEAALRAAQEQVRKAQEAAQEAQKKGQDEEKARMEAQKKAQAEALAKAQEAQKKAQDEAKARMEAQKKAQAEALAKAQEAQKKSQDEAKARMEAQKKAQAEALAKAQEAQKKSQDEAKARMEAQKKAQAEALAKAQEAQKKSQDEAKARMEAQKKAQAEALAKAQEAQKKSQDEAKARMEAQKKAQEAQKKAQVQPQANGVTQRGTLSKEQPIQQEIHAAANPKWSRTPGKVQTQGPQPEQPKQAAAVAPPQGNTALRQTAQIQEQDLAQEKVLTKSPMMARKPQIQSEQLAQKFIEKPEKPVEKISVQKGNQLDGAKRWIADSEARELAQNMQTESGPKAVILQDDACWQTQKRVPVETQQPQVGKIQIPELSEKEIQRTIVAQPASYHKVQWNEFPEELKIELGSVPKTKTQEWIPVNQEQIELQRSLYKPSRISAVWPPVQEENLKEGHTPLIVKANEDTTWIQQDQSGVTKQAVWGKTSRMNRVWPPPENENIAADFSGPQHMPVVQWPPPEAEAHEREQVEVLQKHIPTKKIERQWPPPPPQYQVVESSGEIETQYNPAETAQQTPVNSLRMGHIEA